MNLSDSLKEIGLELASARVPFKALAAIPPGLPAARAEDWINVGGAYLLCTGSEDPLCTPGQLFAFTSALQDAGVDWRVNVYGGAKHAFWAAPMNPDGSLTGGTTHAVATVPGVGHHALHAKRAWRAVLDLLSDTSAAHRMADMAYALVVDEFSVDRMVDRLVEVYREVSA